MQLILVLSFEGEKKFTKKPLTHLKIHKVIAWMGKFTQECKDLKINSIF